MPDEKKCRHYVVLNGAGKSELHREYARNNREWIAGYIAKQSGMSRNFQLIDLPSREIGDPIEMPAGDAGKSIDALVVALEISDEDTARRLIDVANSQERSEEFVGSGADIPLAAGDHWCPREASDPIFADREAAERSMGVDFLKAQNKTRQKRRDIVTSGQNVQVVVVDQGLDQALIPEKNWGGGWSVHDNAPGATKTSGGDIGRTHGMMIAQNILAVAPDVKLFDLPMAPSRIANIQDFFLSTAYAAAFKMMAGIVGYQAGQYPGPWILVNPWGIFDTSSECPTGSYTNNRDHPFNLIMRLAVAMGIDVVFAAGNCGQFCPDVRCGIGDTGPGRSIWGANSLEEVLTVGAVRADEMWLGYSSQGPGQPNVAGNKPKPDLCATSQFRENRDAFCINTGTSTACAIASGVLAALRSTWDSATVSPGEMKKVLIETARKPAGFATSSDLKERLGNGILDTEAAFKRLVAAYP